MIKDPFATVGVVPIFVNAGAALVPTLVASFTSVAAILLKPKELLALFRRKPWVPVAVILIATGLWFGIARLLSTPASAAASTKKTPETALASRGADYWTNFALKQIQEEANAKKTTGVIPLWDFPADEGMVLSTPTVSTGGDRVFATAAVQDVASYFGVLYCADAMTGKPIWKAEKAGDEDLKPFFSSPTLSADGKYLVIGQGLHDSADCSFLCFETATGALHWKVKTPLHIESSPAIRGDLAVVGCGAIEGPDHKPTSHPGYVLAVRISDGKELWRHDVADAESSPAIGDDGTVYIGSGFNGNAVVALRGESDEELKSKNLKRELWKTPAPFPITGPVTIVGDLVLVGGGNSDFVFADPKPAGVILALDRKTGVVRWQAPMDDSVLNQMVASDGKLYAAVRNGSVVSLNLADGKPIWTKRVSGNTPVKAGIALQGQTLFTVSCDGYLILVNAADGSVIEKHPLNAKGKPGQGIYSLSTPMLAKDKLYVGSETGGLHCFQSVAKKS